MNEHNEILILMPFYFDEMNFSSRNVFGLAGFCLSIITKIKAFKKRDPGGNACFVFGNVVKLFSYFPNRNNFISIIFSGCGNVLLFFGSFFQ